MVGGSFEVCPDSAHFDLGWAVLDNSSIGEGIKSAHSHKTNATWSCHKDAKTKGCKNINERYKEIRHWYVISFGRFLNICQQFQLNS